MMTLPDTVFDQVVALCGAVLLLTGVLIVWRRSVGSAIRLLSVQGVALGVLVLAIGVHLHEVELIAVAMLVLVLKAVVLPAVLGRAAGGDRRSRAQTPVLNTTASLIVLSLLTILAYFVGRPLQAAGSGPVSTAVPVGVALVLYGFFVLVTRQHAVFQLVGFLMLDNGIATVAFLLSGGVPLVVELGASLDVLLVVLILQVLSGRIRRQFGGVDLDDLTELKD